SFVTISPSHFQSVKAGSSIPLILKIAFPTNTTTPSRYDGVVQLRSEKSVLAKPLPVELGVDVVSARPPDSATIIQDGYTKFPVNEVIVMLRDGTSISDAQSFAASVGATVIGAIPQVSIFQLATP